MDIVEQIMKLKSEQEALGYEIVMAGMPYNGEVIEYLESDCYWHVETCKSPIVGRIYRRRKTQPKPERWLYAPCMVSSANEWIYEHPISHRGYKITDPVANFGGIEYSGYPGCWQSEYPYMLATPKRVRIQNPEWR